MHAEHLPSSRSADSMSAYLNKEYSPSQWSKRFTTAEQVLHHHYAFIREHSGRVRARWPPITLAYGPEDADRLDIYTPVDQPSGAPICVFVHGGYWQAGSRDDSAFVATRLCDMGYSVWVLGYALCPRVGLDEQVKRIRMAADFIGHHARRNGAKHVTYVGHSAGAHLIACMLDSMQTTGSVHLASIRNVFLVSGVYDLRELRTVDAVNASNVLGLREEMAAALSPLLHRMVFDTNRIATANNNCMNMCVMVAEHDSPTFQRQSREYVDALRKSGWNGMLQFEVISDCDHFDIVERLVDGGFPLTRYIAATA